MSIIGNLAIVSTLWILACQPADESAVNPDPSSSQYLQNPTVDHQKEPDSIAASTNISVLYTITFNKNPKGLRSVKQNKEEWLAAREEALLNGIAALRGKLGSAMDTFSVLPQSSSDVGIEIELTEVQLAKVKDIPEIQWVSPSIPKATQIMTNDPVYDTLSPVQIMTNDPVYDTISPRE